MSGNKCNGNSHVQSTRVSRLLKVRELRKNNNNNNKFPPDPNVNVNDGAEFPELDVSGNSSYVQQYLETAAAAFPQGWDAVDGKPIKQRLLVVANRLPVSAVRKGEDSWSLEISAGGLVSALLGQ